MIEEAREWLLQLCDGDIQSIRLSDWNALLGLPSRSATDVQSLFYLDAPPNVVLEVDGGSYRRSDFLGAFDDTAYYNAWQAVLAFPERRFPDIQAMLRTGRHDGKVMSQVMTHVVQWVNPAPAKVGDRENNKPPLWRDLTGAFKHGSGGQGAAEGQAQELQRRIFDVLRGRINEVSDLSKMPDTDGESYLERFESSIWKDILVTVHGMVGPYFYGVMAKFNKEDPITLTSRQEPSLVSAIGKAIRKAPDIAQNPALRNKAAIEILMGKLSPLIIAWAFEQCTETLRIQELGRAPALPPSVLKTISSTVRDLDPLIHQSPPVRRHRTVPWAKPHQITSQNPSNQGTSSPPELEPSPEFPVRSPVESELTIIPERPHDLELPCLVMPTIDFEIDEAELQRRRHQQRRSSGGVPISLSRKPTVNQGTAPLPGPGAAKVIPADETLPWTQTAQALLPASGLSSKRKRPWAGRPVAHSQVRRPLPGASPRPRKTQP